MAGMQKDGRTVFVRGISFDLDDKPFEEVFSNVGPVKQCFLVRTKGEPRHKGFGFVQYALQEDAARAVEQLNGQAISGRKLMVELANKRAPLGERKRKRTDGTAEPDTPSTPAIAIDAVPSNSSVPAAAKPPAERRSQKTGQEAAQVQIHAGGAQPPKRAAKNPKPGQGAAATAPAARSTAVDAVTAQKRHRLMRTVAVGGLTRESVAAALAVARKAGQVEEVEDPAPEEAVSRARLTADGCSGHVLLVTYPTVQEAVQAVMKLHGLKLRSPAAAATAAGAHPGGKAQKKQAAGGSEAAAGAEGGAGDLPVRVWARQMAGEGAHVRKWRVIVRNLAFKASEAQVKAVLGQAGFVWEVTLPRGPDGRSKGFAFATFMTRAHAEKAIQLCNAKEIAGRPVAVDWALAKSQYQQAGAVGASGAGADGARSPSPAPHDEQLGSEELDDGGDEDTDGDEDDDTRLASRHHLLPTPYLYPNTA